MRVNGPGNRRLLSVHNPSFVCVISKPSVPFKVRERKYLRASVCLGWGWMTSSWLVTIHVANSVVEKTSHLQTPPGLQKGSDRKKAPWATQQPLIADYSPRAIKKSQWQCTRIPIHSKDQTRSWRPH